MAKPTRVQAKQTYAYVDSTPTRRIQSFDYTSNFTIDSVFELGNAGIVEDSITLVETGVTTNSNEWGTVDLEAQMFGIHESRNILGIGTSGVANTTGSIFLSSYGAGGDWSSVVAGDWLQVIRFNQFPTTNAAQYVKVRSIRYAAASLCNVVGLSATFNLDFAPATSDIVSLVNKYTITQDTVDSKPVHFVLPHRHSTSSTLLMHSVILPRCFVDNLTYNFDTGGAAEQNYTLVGEEERLLLGSRREAQSIAGSFMSYTGDTLTFRVPIDSLSATGSPYAVYAEANLVNDINGTGTIVHTSGQATVTAKVGTGLGLGATDQIVYYFSNIIKKGYKGITNLDSGIGKLTKGYMRVELQQASGTVEKLTRLSGGGISHPLTRESIDELGESRSIAKPLEGNLRNEITLTFTKNDLREYAKLLGKQEAFDAETLTEILMTDLKAVKNMTIVFKFYNSQNTHNDTTLLKTMTYEDCNFIGDNVTQPISGAGGVEFAFSSQTINIVGSGLPPTYS